MRSGHYMVMGFIFILASGFIYTLERISAQINWLAQTNTGQWDTYAATSFFENVFAPLFFLLGIGFLVVAKRQSGRKQPVEQESEMEQDMRLL